MPKLYRTWIPLIVGTIPIIAADQLIKFWIRKTFTLYQSVDIVPHLLNLTYTANPGAAFSLFATLPNWVRSAFLSSVSIFASIVLVILLARGPDTVLSGWGFALVLAGAVGNLLDRLRYGVVLDFIDVHYYDLHYPVFNLADCAITVGVALLIIDTVLRTTRRRHPQEASGIQAN